MGPGEFSVKFWGVRGTMATPGTQTIRYGGNTSCVEMRVDQHVLVFDAGTGISYMGETPGVVDIDLFLSHTHLDHICGWPFFSPAYRKGVDIRVWAGHLAPESTIKDALSQMMSPPVFPLTLDFLSANITYNDFEAGQTLNIPHLNEKGITISTLPLKHPDKATAYRVDYKGKSACYVTDVEHVRDGLDKQLVEFVKDSNVFIYDSTFDDRNFDRFVGWGHSTWQEGVRIADAANVETLVLFHHDPGMSDDDLDHRLEELTEMRPRDRIAREGMLIKLS